MFLFFEININFVDMRLENYLKQLLFQYDCIVVPDFGTFITFPMPTEINSEENIVNPPFKMIKFSTTIINDDGILKNTYVLNENINLEQASIQLKKDIDQWNTILSEKKSLILDKIGKISIDTNGTLKFEPHIEENFFAYGLKPLKPNLVLTQNTGLLSKSGKKNWSSILMIASVLPILVGGYFYFNTPQPIQKFVDHQWSGIVLPAIKEATPNLLNSSTKEKKASNKKNSIHNLPSTIINPLEFLKSNPIDSTGKKMVSKYEITVIEENQLNENEKEVTAIIKNSKVEIPVKKVETTPNTTKEGLRIDSNPKKYQVIAASLRRADDAARMLDFLKSEGYKNASIIYVNGFYYYVTFDCFDDSAQAKKYLNNLQKQRPDAWIRERKENKKTD